ncbi:protein translocase subunit SecF [Haloarchaeobius amylolyticus]|uniref:protein translocase subunit SecF n=1 Tax=Haloarchaeobius amylolyticus TaxID=1198296 RepID=UPI002271CA26|nr:protein translocase subunit SecF [Haloarchaeobius amylolyticus]
MSKFEVPEVDYTRYSNRQLAAVPLALLAVALVVILGWYVMFGTPVGLSTDFTGGTELTVQTDTPRSELDAAFEEDIISKQRVQGPSITEPTYILTFGPESEGTDLADQAQANLQATCSNPDECEIIQSRQTTSPSFGSSARTTAAQGLFAAFLGMSILAFVFFRSFIPSIAIVVSAFSDIVIPLAAMNLLGIKLSLGTVAALLMLIGYSVDSDILLNNHVLRRSGGFYDSVNRAMQTGVTMTITSMAAMAVMTVVATLFGIELMASIGLVLVLGLAADLVNTYMLNLSLLRWYKLGEVNPQ